jgi:hypothetical protein
MWTWIAVRKDLESEIGAAILKLAGVDLCRDGAWDEAQCRLQRNVALDFGFVLSPSVVVDVVVVDVVVAAVVGASMLEVQTLNQM